jgi:hypothetical protein
MSKAKRSTRPPRSRESKGEARPRPEQENLDEQLEDRSESERRSMGSRTAADGGAGQDVESDPPEQGEVRRGPASEIAPG